MWVGVGRYGLVGLVWVGVEWSGLEAWCELVQVAVDWCGCVGVWVGVG